MVWWGKYHYYLIGGKIGMGRDEDCFGGAYKKEDHAKMVLGTYQIVVVVVVDNVVVDTIVVACVGIVVEVVVSWGVVV